MKIRARHASRTGRTARAQRFYERAGFTLEGEPFVEDGLPQRAMRRVSRPEDDDQPA